jgi:hypothetical protein
MALNRCVCVYGDLGELASPSERIICYGRIV